MLKNDYRKRNESEEKMTRRRGIKTKKRIQIIKHSRWKRCEEVGVEFC